MVRQPHRLHHCQVWNVYVCAGNGRRIPWPGRSRKCSLAPHHYPHGGRGHAQGSAGALYSRKPEIIADAAYAIFCRDSKEFTGNFFVDDEVLLDAGVKNFAKYACYPEYIHLLETDAFLDEKGPVAKL